MNKCAAGNELPKRGACPKCGARDNEPCPEAFRIASEERETLLTALRRIRSLEPKNVSKYAQQIAGEALDLVGSPKP